MTNLRVIVAMNADKVGSTEANVSALSSAQRMKNGFKFLGISWAVALATVFVPVFHFILVPSFLLVGIAMFFVGYKRTQFLSAAQVICPNCGNTIEIKNLSFNWPVRLACSKCNEALLIAPS